MEVTRLNRAVYIPAAAVFVLLLALSGLYGYHRDELYFLDCARHLSASYVDQPILTPLLARFSLILFGPSLVGLRLWVALAAALTVLLGALLARELGGGAKAQLLAAVATATAPVLLAVGHLFGPTAFDIPAWAALALIALKAGREPRWWLAGGVVLGLGLANKHSIGFFAVALTAGALLSGGRRVILNRWFLLGAIIAALFTVPDIWWQATHDWATIAMTRQLNQENGGLGNVPSWLFGQLIMSAFALIFLWIVGLRSLWRSGDPMRRALVWAYGILFLLFALTSGAKIYYEAGLYVPLLAAGAVVVAERGFNRVRLIAGTALSVLVALPLVLPVLPAADIGWTYPVNQENAESVGWPELVAAVTGVWNSLPADQRAHAVIYTADYGEAGAIATLGRGLPKAVVSGHNSLWWWGPGDPGATTVVAVMPGPVDGTGFDVKLGRHFGQVLTAATLTNTAGLHNEEWHGHVYVCTDPLQPWGQMWPSLRHYD